MLPIHIQETFNDEKSVSISVDGNLDMDSVPLLKDVCQKHLIEGLEVILNLSGLRHISREGRSYLGSIRDKVRIENPPSFMQLQP